MAITQKELEISNKSYTNKDFASIYPELLELCTKLTASWSPDTSNESDPGIVLLKLAAFIADKNNYNIDKNVLECFMPSATQEASMRNLCEMNGYNIGYYNSAVTPISFMYTNTIAEKDSFTLPKYTTVLTSDDESVSYTLVNDCTISKQNQTYSVEAIEGTIEILTVGDSTVVQLSNIDDNNRLYIPDIYVAENGIFITDANGNNLWSKVDNLNAEELGNTFYKFGFDSSKGLPYIEFPSDISNLIGDGLIVKYIISSGAAGNISANTLTVLSSPSSVISSGGTEINDLSTYLVVNNLYATADGKNPESIDEAYSGFKKTVGTFNTLVTCRDYANFIYNLVDPTTLKFIVSNIQVADRRTDINYSNHVVTYDLNAGKHAVRNTDDDVITPYDLCMYPLKPIETNYNITTYKNSFLPLGNTAENLSEEQDFNDAKCISHNIKDLDDEDIYTLKNYYRLNAKIYTYDKIDANQQEELLDNVRSALYKNFNARNVDYGQEIPYETLLSCIQSSDARISNVILAEPELTTYVMSPSGAEVPLWGNSSSAFAKKSAKNIVAKNVLSGTISLFDKNENYEIDLGQQAPSSSISAKATFSNVEKAKSEVKFTAKSLKNQVNLKANEIIQFIAPNIVSEKDYGSYVNYRFEPDPTMTYTLLTEQPADWETKYNKYYKLVDGKYIQLTEPETFESGKYYSGTYNYSQMIAKNTHHQLAHAETLSFVYTDSETNVEHTYVYTATSVTVDGTETTGVTNVFKSTIDIYPVEALSNPTTTVKGGKKFLTLGTSDTISKEGFVYSILDNSMLPCYWIMRNSTNTLFDANDSSTYDPTTKKITVLLENGEYFMYSNSAYTELVILGSGTRLSIDLSKLDNPQTDFTPWVISSDNMLDIEDIQSKGLAAFSALNWQNKILTSTPIKAEEMQIRSYSEDNQVKIKNYPDDFTGLSNAWVDLPGATIEGWIDGTAETLPEFKNLTCDGKAVCWSGHSRLDISCGPNKPQVINGNQIITLKALNDTELTIKGASNTPTYLSFNTNVEFAGSSNYVSINTKIIDGVAVTITDGLEALIYAKSPIKYPISGKPDYSNVEISRRSDGFMPVSLAGFGKSIQSSTVTATDLIMNLINMGKSNLNKDMLLFVYYNANSGSSVSTVTLTSNGLVKHYNTTDSLSNSTTINPGLNTILLDKSSSTTTLRLNHTLNSTDMLYIGKLVLIDGINPRLLYKSVSDEENSIKAITEEDILDALRDLVKDEDGNDIFYYTDSVIAGRELEVDYLPAPDALWDLNNVASRFALGEIRFESEKDITSKQDITPLSEISTISVARTSQKS